MNKRYNDNDCTDIFILLPEDIVMYVADRNIPYKLLLWIELTKTLEAILIKNDCVLCQVLHIAVLNKLLKISRILCYPFKPSCALNPHKKYREWCIKNEN